MSSSLGLLDTNWANYSIRRRNYRIPPYMRNDLIACHISAIFLSTYGIFQYSITLLFIACHLSSANNSDHCQTIPLMQGLRSQYSPLSCRYSLHTPYSVRVSGQLPKSSVRLAVAVGLNRVIRRHDSIWTAQRFLYLPGIWADPH